MRPGDRVALAVSGGADSVALLRLFAELREPLGVTLLVVHFDHALRGAESDSDARFVADLSRASGLEFIFAREDVASVAARHRWNLEDAARRLRYAFFARVVEEGRATRVAVAHTADDQAETIFARLFRGTGPTGLGGIHPVVGSIVRPLIATRRHDLRRYLLGLGQDWREDSTNQDLCRQRAQIREKLLPVLERDFSPRITKHLSELARLSREEEGFWTVFIEDRYRLFVKARGKRLTIRIRDLLLPVELSATSLEGGLEQSSQRRKPLQFSEESASAERPVSKRLIRRLYEGVRGDRRELTANHVDQVIRLASESASGSRIELPGGVIVQRNFDELVFSQLDRAGSRSVTEATAYQYVMQIPEHGTRTISVPELGTRIHLKMIDWSSRERDTKIGQAFDADLLGSSLMLRNWRAGDSYRPRGCRNSQKLKRLFLTCRVPRVERFLWPVIECRGSMVWARGMPPADDFCAKGTTRVAVVIEEDRGVKEEQEQ